ncbi:hypothetical protein KP509_26G025900 [Ceratopteris richardii]|uniref:Uncharacterized protein n=1 Tax=Ceratopteris richardii TaxID=49495 RepID=A0A8T2RLS5_CERRI|nr:hypothetical protein KP509_26G025900 [Ceratopteris richardii]
MSNSPCLMALERLTIRHLSIRQEARSTRTSNKVSSRDVLEFANKASSGDILEFAEREREGGGGGGGGG